MYSSIHLTLQIDLCSEPSLQLYLCYNQFQDSIEYVRYILRDYSHCLWSQLRIIHHYLVLALNPDSQSLIYLRDLINILPIIIEGTTLTDLCHKEWSTKGHNAGRSLRDYGAIKDKITHRNRNGWANISMMGTFSKLCKGLVLIKVFSNVTLKT